MGAEGKTALVLSAGGMFGAYQAGAWAAIADRVRIDLVVGASIGSLNAWAIAGGCSPGELRERWLHMESAGTVRWRLPWPPLSGAIDASMFESSVREIWQSYSPVRPCGVVLTDLIRMRPVLYAEGQITWRHLAASCAVPGLLPVYAIEGRRYVDGGLLNALPLWAAEKMGARRILAVNAWTPAAWMRLALQGVKLRGRIVQRISPDIDTLRIRPAGQLGSMRDALYWNRANVERWLEQGRRDAEAQLRTGWGG